PRLEALEDRLLPAQQVLVAVLDTGVDVYHPAINGLIWSNPRETAGNGTDDDGNGYLDDTSGYDFVNNRPDVADGSLHRTAVEAAVASVVQTLEVPEVRVQILPLRVVDDQGKVNEPALVRAIHYAADEGAQVINLSLKYPINPTVMEALTAAQTKGVIIVAAAGNDATQEQAVPG